MSASPRTVIARLLRGALGDECLIWKGTRNWAGYGRIGSERSDGSAVILYAHRAMYEALHGPIPDGAVVMHSCSVPACINPAHLRVGTQAENIAQRDAEGRTQRVGKPKTTPERHLAYLRQRYRARRSA